MRKYYAAKITISWQNTFPQRAGLRNSPKPKEWLVFAKENKAPSGVKRAFIRVLSTTEKNI